MPLLRILIVLLATVGLQGANVDYQRDVRPILSNSCYACHGPDSDTRLAGLRLDTQQGAQSERPNGTPVVPGDAASSLIYQRITHQQTALRMPPASAHKELTPEQIDLLKRWIDEGAVWSSHWAFREVTLPTPPTVAEKAWIRNPIDSFVLARLEAAGLQPAAEADRRVLARRATLDITGLPPTPESVERFVDDSSPSAYEDLIDRLLESDAYGEHRAKYWLDAARYADTHGLHIDNYREMWPYRDWVIGAFNGNMPFDQFTIEQLAGDMLPTPTQAQLVATGFQRCNITTNEGGVIEKEVEEIYAKDRAETLATVWLALTVGCATCHDHKFDPIKQKDFYALGAFFRNTSQPVMDGNVYDTPPVMVVLEEEERQRWDDLTTSIAATRRELRSLQSKGSAGSKKLRSAKARSGIDFEHFDSSEVLSLEDVATLPDGATHTEGPSGGAAVELPEDTVLEVPNFDGVGSEQPFTISAWIRGKTGRFIVAAQTERVEPEANYDERGWTLEMSGGRAVLRLIGDREFDLGIRAAETEARATAGEWSHLIASYDGSRLRSGMALYLDGTRLETESTGRAISELAGEIRRSVPLTIGGRMNDDNSPAGPGGQLADFRVLSREVNEADAKLLFHWARLKSLKGKKIPSGQRADREALAAYYLARQHESYPVAAERLAALQNERSVILATNPLTHVMNERTDSKPTAHVLFRGMYDQPGEEVAAATPSALPPMDADLPRNRLGLAKWLVDDSNPLTARVTVNRMWQEVFGVGLVRTAGDFGSQGEAPTHPELLDWLAADFRDHGWDVKRFYKQLLMSAAYRQSAKVDPVGLEKDPENLLLSRGPRFRLDAEVVRDYALATSGLLTTQVGGRSVKPYQPAGVWEPIAMPSSNTRFYSQDHGEDLYRRSLYTFWKRAAPSPSMLIFDAPTRESCTVQRERTNTPLQALVTMNAPQFFEAALHLASASEQHTNTLDGRLDYMSARLLSRPLTTSERAIVSGSYQEFMRHYDSHPDDARAALSVGEKRTTPQEGAASLASLAMVANQLMNLDEALNK
ncbi:MAG: DUF1553 domain-containing protein [Acidobacteria bacterium]|nr:DUF1553 domain-containing protein [Acidobacteriota bacterium]